MKSSLLVAFCLTIPSPGQAQDLVWSLPLDATAQALMDSGLDLAAASLARALLMSRDEARRAGTRPIPPQIRQALLTRFPADLLDGIEYRVGAGEDATVQSLAIRYGDALAVATIDTITFADAWDAENNIALWAHEVVHVQQFRDWGVQDFARRYVRDHAAVEREAYAVGAEFQALYGGG
jgi:hypothetical protein